MDSLNNADLDRLAMRKDSASSRFPYETIETFAKAPVKKRWLVKGVIAKGETSAWIAPPGGMKSALMAHLAFAVALGPDGGRSWHGKKVKTAGSVLYFALERADLTRRRLRAHHIELGLPEEDDHVSQAVAIVPVLVNLMDPAVVPKVLATIRAFEEDAGFLVDLIIFDTFAKAISAGGGDENQAKDQGRVFANLQRIKDATNAHIAIVGHTGKDIDRGARGSNAFLGDVDVMVTISGDQIKTATITKANDMPEGPLFSFKGKVHEFGVDEDGDPITVNIVSDEELSAQTAPKGSEPKLTANQKTLFGMLHDAGATGLTLEDWNTQAKHAGIGVKRKADLNDIRSSLQSKGLIRHYGDRWFINHG